MIVIVYKLIKLASFEVVVNSKYLFFISFLQF